MKKILSTKYSAGAFNMATLLLRLTMGIVAVYYGYKLMADYSNSKNTTQQVFGLSQEISLLLKIFIKLLCGLLVVFGLFSRIAAGMIVIYLGYVLYAQYHLQFFGSGNFALIFFGGFMAILLLGPGKYSVDSAMGR